MTPYYNHAGITIYHGDCRDVLPSISADVLITDPPYGVNLGEHVGANETRSGYLAKTGYASYQDTDANLRAIVAPAIVTALSMVKRGVVFCAGSKIGAFPEGSCIGGVYLPAGCGRTAWGFQNLATAIFYGTAPGLEKGAKPTVIRSTAAAAKTGHPCPKPLPWMAWLVMLASLECETIIDPFMGGGTTLRAAKDAGRRAIGIEIEERYCEIAAKQLGQEVLFGVTNG